MLDFLPYFHTQSNCIVVIVQVTSIIPVTVQRKIYFLHLSSHLANAVFFLFKTCHPEPIVKYCHLYDTSECGEKKYAHFLCPKIELYLNWILNLLAPASVVTVSFSFAWLWLTGIITVIIQDATSSNTNPIKSTFIIALMSLHCHLVPQSIV